MLRDELKELEQHSGNPAISLIAPMRKTFPGLKENPVILKNQIKIIKEKLEAGYDKKLAEKYVSRLEKIAEEIDYENVNNGLGIFLSDKKEKILHLPFEPNEQSIVDQSFQVRDLVFTNNRTVKYWVVCVSEAPSRLLEGFGQELKEVVDDNLPTYYIGPEKIGHFDPNVVERPDYDQLKDEYLKKYYRMFDDLIFERIQRSDMPVIVVGTAKNLSLFMDAARSARFVAGRVEGNHVSHPVHELSKLVWPVIEDKMKKERDNALSELEEAIGKNRYTAGLQSVWEMAFNGRIATLFVERNHSTPAYLSADHSKLYTGNDEPDNDQLVKVEDAVDDAIENVIKSNGKVHFLSEGRLKDHEKIAGITRY